MSNSTQAMVIADQLNTLEFDVMVMVATQLVKANKKKAGNLEFALSVALKDFNIGDAVDSWMNGTRFDGVDAQSETSTLSFAYLKNRKVTA
jgi:hypothetical protein